MRSITARQKRIAFLGPIAEMESISISRTAAL